MAPLRDENVIIIAPGSQTTLAQLGLPESFTPPARRFPTRMFPAPDGKTFEPHKIRLEKKGGPANGEDVEMAGTGGNAEEDEEEVPVEYPDDDEGAIYPLKEGRIENMPAFLALLEYIHAEFKPTLHSPVLLIAQPCWTSKNLEDITQWIFEKTKTPALCIMDSALATSYAYGAESATIIDVGFEKVDVTAVTHFLISGRGTVPHSGGEAMTQRLAELLKAKNFTRDMAEQLKKSPICEILTPGTPLPGGEEPAAEVVSNPAAAATTGALSSGPSVKITEPPRAVVPEPDIPDDDYNGDDKVVDDDGVLDVASIVASGKTQEFLAKKEKEKAERAAARKATRDAEKAEAAAAAAKPQRLPNSKRPRAIFHYEEILKEPNAKRQKSPDGTAAPPPAIEEPTSAAEPKPENGLPAVDGAAVPADEAARKEQQKAARKEERRKVREEENPDRIRRDFEIGLERFGAADGGILDAIADTVYRTILSVDEVHLRQHAWDNLIICGLGCKVRGFREALIATLNNRYIVSPSSATMFMSELPSNLATPSGTGAQTPNASFSSTPHAPPTASAVNPLLLAATTAASHPQQHQQLSVYGNGERHHSHSSHSQSPTSIKLATPPTYFPEWKTFEEAVFLGAQVAGKVCFTADQGALKGLLRREEYNEEGPTGIHQVGLVY